MSSKNRYWILRNYIKINYKFLEIIIDTVIKFYKAYTLSDISICLKKYARCGNMFQCKIVPF